MLYVSSEVFPLAKAGGLADVSAALPASLRDQGIDVQLLMPGYPCAMELAGDLRLATVIENPLGFGRVRIWKGTVPSVLAPVWLVECQSLYSRDGNPYQDEQGRDFPDNALRFGLLSYIGAMIGARSAGMSWCPDLIHINDWQTAPLPSMLRQWPGPYPPTVLAIYNLAHQGVFRADVAQRLAMTNSGGVLAKAAGDDQISFLQTGILTADRVATVSPTYAAEIRTPEYGCGLDNVLLRLKAPVLGILNGVDCYTWNPTCDPHLAENYHAVNLSRKRKCKASLQEELGLNVQAGTPLIAFMSRLAWQKMPEVVLDALPALLAEGIQFGLVAEGDRRFEDAFRKLAAAYPGKVGVRIGYDEAVAHRLVAGADMMLSPARYEPCGLTAVYAMRYGTPPIARRTGGLVDTVVDVQPRSLIDGSATGFLFDDPNAEEMILCVHRALQLFRQKSAWRRVQLAGMLRDFSWMRSAREYIELYRQMLGDSGRSVQVTDMKDLRSHDRGGTTTHPIPAAGNQPRSIGADTDTARADQIRRRAYEIWEDRGRPHGHDLEHWLQAEAEVAVPRQAPTAKARQSDESNSRPIKLRRKAPRPGQAGIAQPEADTIPRLKVAS